MGKRSIRQQIGRHQKGSAKVWVEVDNMYMCKYSCRTVCMTHPRYSRIIYLIHIQHYRKSQWKKATSCLKSVKNNFRVLDYPWLDCGTLFAKYLNSTVYARTIRGGLRSLCYHKGTDSIGLWGMQSVFSGADDFKGLHTRTIRSPRTSYRRQYYICSSISSRSLTLLWQWRC